MPPKFKSEAEKQAARTQILDAARELFVAKGVEAVTMREIAKKIGYSATTIYLHFKDKEALLRAICDADFLKLAGVQKTILQMTDPVQRLVALGEGHAKFALAYPNHYRLMFMTPHEPCSPEKSSLEQNNPEHDAYFQLKSVVEDVMQAGKFKSHLTNVELLTQTIWAGIHGVCTLEIMMGRDTWVSWQPVETRVAAMLNMTLVGLLKEPV